MSLVAISGSQGSGKSTIISKLEEQGFPIIDRKTSRSILSDWNTSLQEVNNNPTLTTQFQEEIIKRKAEDEYHALKSSHIWFTERTFADLFTYAVVSLGKDNNFSEWLNDYYRQCMRYNQTYDLVYYLKAGHFAPEKDGTRGDNIHYSRMVDLTMLDFTQQLTHNSKLTIIDTPDLQQRVTIITEQTKALLNQIRG